MLCKYAVTAAAEPLYEKPGSGIVLLGMLGLGLPPTLGSEREREREELNLSLFVGIGQYSATLTLHPLRTLPVARNFYQYELTVHLTKQLPFPLWSGECVLHRVADVIWYRHFWHLNAWLQVAILEMTSAAVAKRAPCPPVPCCWKAPLQDHWVNMW